MLLLHHAWQLYRHDVTAGSKAHIAGYGAVQAFITAVLAYYMSGERVRGNVGVRNGGNGEGEKVGEERKCKEAKMK